ncbi:hypothetical protein SAY86_031496 [Trapa natans]|uniref:Uncharacterized protein n=1 Tax=Trapa natans TaxID=22666 RepID=A0AAN7LM02_TRANT|nr:hypothetical protein SAY86_031496 [Trapa natans]
MAMLPLQSSKKEEEERMPFEGEDPMMSVKDELWQGVEDKQTPPATRTRSRQPNEPKEGSHILPETQERRHTGRSGGGFGRHRLPGSGGGGLGGDDDAGPGPASAVLVLLDGGVEGFEMAPAPSPCVLPALLADHLVAHSFFSFFFVLVSFLRFGKAAASSFLTADGWKTGDEQLMVSLSSPIVNLSVVTSSHHHHHRAVYQLALLYYTSIISASPVSVAKDKY